MTYVGHGLRQARHDVTGSIRGQTAADVCKFFTLPETINDRNVRVPFAEPAAQIPAVACRKRRKCGKYHDVKRAGLDSFDQLTGQQIKGRQFNIMTASRQDSAQHVPGKCVRLVAHGNTKNPRERAEV